MSADIQSIAFLITDSETFMTSITPATERRMTVSMIKKLYDALTAAKYIFFCIFDGRNIQDTSHLRQK